MRGDVVEEALWEIEAPQVLQAVQQPVGVGGIAARLELPEPDEPRHAGVDRFVEQMLQFAPKPGRNPLGDAGFDLAFGVDQRVGADPLDCRRGRQDRSRAPAGTDEPARQVLVRPRQRRLFAEPVAELTRRAARAESVQPAQLGKMLVPGLGPHRVVGQFVPVHVELATDHDRRRNELARSRRSSRTPEARWRAGADPRTHPRWAQGRAGKAAEVRAVQSPGRLAAATRRYQAPRSCDTSVAELCSELGIRPVTLYRYVGPQGQLREALAGDVGTRQPTAREGQVGPVRVAERSVGYRGSRVMPAEGRDLRWKRWRNAAGSREWPTA